MLTRTYESARRPWTWTGRSSGRDELVTPRVKDAIGRLAARIPVFIATGREPHDVFNYARQLGLTGPQLSDGGAAILDPVACTHIWSANLGPELAPEVLGLVEQLGAHFVATHVEGTFPEGNRHPRLGHCADFRPGPLEGGR